LADFRAKAEKALKREKSPDEIEFERLLDEMIGTTGGEAKDQN